MGYGNGIAPEVLAWVKQFPHCLASYKDESQKENMYIYNPKVQQEAFVSPRSLAKASFIVSQRHTLGEMPTLVSLAGTIGESAARDMSAYFSLADALPTKEAIYKKPSEASVPNDPSARVILVMRELMSIKKENVEAWLTYMQRLPRSYRHCLLSTSWHPNVRVCLQPTKCLPIGQLNTINSFEESEQES